MLKANNLAVCSYDHRNLYHPLHKNPLINSPTTHGLHHSMKQGDATRLKFSDFGSGMNFFKRRGAIFLRPTV